MAAEKIIFRINPRDNVVVALRDIKKGETVTMEGLSITAVEDIPRGHKIAPEDFPEGAQIYKYGNPIGHTTAFVPAGSWLHNHNMKTNLDGLLEYTYEHEDTPPVNTEGIRTTFRGYRRANGTVGTRNEIWIIPTVSCVNQAKRHG